MQKATKIVTLWVGLKNLYYSVCSYMLSVSQPRVKVNFE